MSESAPETPGREPGGGSPFTRKFGPLPLWGWMAVGLAIALAYYWIRQNKANSAAANASTDTGTSSGSVDVSGQIPQFVNQTYVQGTPPQAPPVTPSPPTVPVNVTVNSPAPGPATAVKTPVITVPHALDRSWTAPNSNYTVAEIGKGLKLANPGSALQPGNAIAKTFMTKVYPKNHNAKVPKGAHFTYVAGT